MKLVAWTILLLATMIWTVAALVGALATVGIGGGHAYGEVRFWGQSGDSLVTVT